MEMSFNEKSYFTFALFGFGRAGKIHFVNLLANCRAEVKYIVDENVDSARENIAQFRVPIEVVPPTETDRIMSDPEVDAVVVSSPTFTHEAIICSALTAGKAVYSEKPISENVDGTRKCYDVADSMGKPLFCSFNRRFDPSVRKVHDRVKSGEIGEVHLVKTTSRDHPLPSMDYLRISGGFFHDCAVHDLDMMTWILDELPNRVTVTAHCQHPGILDLNDVDTAVISLKFPSGRIGVIDISRHAVYGYDQRVEVLGSKGLILSNNQISDGFNILNESGGLESVLLRSFPERYSDSYKISLNNFLDVLQGKATMDVTKNVCINVSLMAEACEKSYRSDLSVDFISYS